MGYVWEAWGKLLGVGGVSGNHLGDIVGRVWGYVVMFSDSVGEVFGG